MSDRLCKSIVCTNIPIAVFKQVRSPRDVISNDSDDDESDDDDMDIFDMVNA